ncbi:hypothetical protein [Microbacterium sp. NPDC055455]
MPVSDMYECSAAASVVGMCPITTLAARSRRVIAATAFSAGVAASSGDGDGVGVEAADGERVGEAVGVGAGAQDAHAITAAATTAAKHPTRAAAVIHQA